MADNMERRVTDLEKKQVVQDAKFEAFMQEMRDFKTEMRDRDNQRAREISELRQAQAAQQARHDQNMEQLRQDLKETSKEVRNLFIAFVGIIVAIMVGMFWTR